MNPSITSPVPAKDEMGMDYIPVYAEEAGRGEDDALVGISPVMVNNLSVRTAPVTRGPLAREIDTVGYIEFDERLVSRVDLRVEGWIEDLQVRTRGEHVREGDLLFRIYSPELEAAQREYLQSTSAGSASLRAAGAERLRALGLNDAQIERLSRTGQPEPLVPIYARHDGIVAELNVREGSFVTPGTTVMTLAGLQSVWIIVDVFEQQADWVAVGQTAEVRLPHKPNRVWTGELEYIYPQLDPETRTLKVRLRFQNPDETLLPNMYADVTVHAEPREQTLSVPSAAVIRTGDGARVILARGDGRFDPVPVTTGIESEDRVEILDGLTVGDEVVISAQFLLDSEANLQASLRRMSDPKTGANGMSVQVEPAAIRGEGTLNRVDAESRTVNLSHGPISELGWPAMTMDFTVDENVSLAAFEAGQPVSFTLRETDGGVLIIELDPAE
jgi:Cu(I)/Ag(I) efflux system membrane fusion protein